MKRAHVFFSFLFFCLFSFTFAFRAFAADKDLESDIEMKPPITAPMPGSYELARPTYLFSYDHWARLEILRFLDVVERRAGADSEPVAGVECRNFSDLYTSDGVLDIRYNLGYFDDSTGKAISWAGWNWGYSPSADEGVFQAWRSVLKESCPNNTRHLCGFTEVSSANEIVRDGKTLLTKRAEIQGRIVDVRITLTHASASPIFLDNIGSLSLRQQHLSQISEDAYFTGIGSADIAFYNGHSRDGGGPDFHPPRLNSAKKPNYDGYYRVHRAGITRLINELKKGPRKDTVIGLFSCDSKLHFERRLLANNQMQKMILTLPGIHYFDALNATTGYLEGLLRGSCGARLESFAKAEKRIADGFVGSRLK